MTASNVTKVDSSIGTASKVFALLLFGLAIELIFFKFVPDLGTATLPTQAPSVLVNLKAFQDYYQTPGGVMYPRFAGTSILVGLAKLIAKHIYLADVRMSPLRLAAGIVTPVYGFVGLIPVMAWTKRYNWRTFASIYCGYCVLSLYVFYPFDMPSIALISVAVFLVLEEKLDVALGVMLLTGLFRESSLHIVWFVLAWAICRRAVPLRRRLGWLAAYSVAFAAEYVAVRRFYPGRREGNFVFDVHEIFLGRGLWSMTCIVTLAIVAIVPALYLQHRGSGWRHDFFVLNCVAVPAWIIFYRIMGGNISELRMLIPVLIPIFYGLAMRSGQSQTNLNGQEASSGNAS